MGQYGRRVSAVVAAIAVVFGYVVLVHALNSPLASRGRDVVTTGQAGGASTTTSTPPKAGPPIAPGPLQRPVAGTYELKVTKNKQSGTGVLIVSADGLQQLMIGNETRPMTLRFSTVRTELLNDAGCSWKPPIVFVAANLAEGRKWSSSASCSATVNGRPTEVRRDETAGVKSRARAYIGATPVDTWLIQRHVIIRETTGTATVVTEEATNELFAPSLGLSVFRTTRTDVSQADGQVVSQVESVELASTTPR